MVADSAAIVLFAIRSAVKLGKQAQLAYIDSTRRRELTLPLPNFFSSTTAEDARRYFSQEGQIHVAGGERDGIVIGARPHIAVLLARFGAGTIDGAGREVLRIEHIECRNIDLAAQGKLEWDGTFRVEPAELLALSTVRQWQRGTDPTPSTLRRMAGTLISIGVEYAATAPDLIDPHSARGGAILGMLRGLDRIDLIQVEASELPAKLFAATLETVSAHPELIGGDAKIQELVSVTTKAVSESVGARLAQIDASNLNAIDRRDARLDAGAWGGLVFRATLSSAGHHVLAQPERFLGIGGGAGGAGQAALVQNVGTAMLGLVLADDGLALDRLLSREGIEVILSGALDALADHPELLLGDDGSPLRELVAQVAGDLAKIDGILTPTMLPEVARLVLARSAENLPLLWPDPVGDPRRNLLVIAAAKALALLSRPAEPGATWTPRFGRAELLLITETVIEEFVENPEWLVTKAGNVSGTLEQALEAAIGAIRRRADRRLSPAVAAEIIRAAILAVSTRKEFLNKLPATAQQAGETILGAALDLVLSTVFGNGPDDVGIPAKVAWQLARAETALALVRAVLDGLRRGHLDATAIEQLRTVLKELVASLNKGAAIEIDGLAALFDTSAP